MNLYQELPVNPAALLNLAESQKLHAVLSTACRLNLFDELSTAKSAGQLAENLNLDTVTAELLLEVLARSGFLVKQADGYANTALSNTYLVRSSFLCLQHWLTGPEAPDSFAGRLAAILQQKDSYEPAPPPDWNAERLREIGVGSLAATLAATVAACDLTGTEQLLDLGGGHGFYSIAFVQKYPALIATVFDRPAVISLAADFARRFQVADRVRLVGGDFRRDDIGSGYDVVFCANVLSMDRQDGVLAKVMQAIKPGGRVIVKTRVADGEGNLPAALDRLARHVYKQPPVYSRQDWYDLLAANGFAPVETVEVNGIFATFAGWKEAKGGMTDKIASGRKVRIMPPADS